MKKSMVILCAMVLFTMVTSDEANANPYYDEMTFFSLTGLTIVEDFESYEVEYPDIYPHGLELSSQESFADGSVVIETTTGLPLWIVFPGQTVTPSALNSKALSGYGEDDYRLLFSSPQQAVGFTYLANHIGDEKVTLYSDEESTQLIDTFNLETYSANNQYNFFGFIVPDGYDFIKVIEFDSIGGASINEALDNLRFDAGNIPEPIPEPTTMLLLGSGLIVLVGFRRKFRKG